MLGPWIKANWKWSSGDGKSERQHCRNQWIEMDWNGWIWLRWPLYLLLWAGIPQKKWSSHHGQQKSPKCSEVKWSEVTQSCPTLCDPIDCSLAGSSVHEIFQAKVLEWIAISFSRGSSRPRDWTQVSRIVDRCFTAWTTREAPTAYEFLLLLTFSNSWHWKYF